jgi:hypothetical protein
MAGCLLLQDVLFSTGVASNDEHLTRIKTPEAAIDGGHDIQCCISLGAHLFREEKVNFVRMKKEEPPPPVEKKKEPPPPPKVKKAEPKAPKLAPLPPAPKAEIAPPKGFKVLEAPVTIPTTIPKIDLSAKITNEADFSGKGVKGGSSTGTEGSEGTKEGAPAGVTVDTDKTYAEFEVERQVSAISGTNVEYARAVRREREWSRRYRHVQGSRVERAGVYRGGEICSAENAIPSGADWQDERCAGCSAGVRVQAQSLGSLGYQFQERARGKSRARFFRYGNYVNPDFEHGFDGLKRI